MEPTIVIISIAVFILFSPVFSKLFNVPVVVIEIFLGMVGGYLGLIYDDGALQTVAHFGFLYLMFLAGLEINIRLLQNIKDKMLLSVLFYFIMLYSLAFLLSTVFGLNIVYTVILPIFSLGMLTILLREYGHDEPWLNLALAIGVIGELISILILTVMSGWLEYGIGAQFYRMIGLFILVLAVGVVSIKALKLLFTHYPRLEKIIMPDTDRMDQDIRVSVSLLFIFIAVMMFIKIDLVLGAFAAGLFLKLNFYQHKILIDKLASFGFGFFVPIFFIYTGSTLKIEMVDMFTLKHALFIISAIIGVRLLSSFAAFYRFLKLKQTILFSLSDSMPLTFLVAFSMLAHQHMFISDREYFAFLLAGMFDVLIVMTLIRKLYGWFGFQESSKSD